MKQQVYKTPNKYVQGLKAYVLDTLAWAYLALVSYKVIYEKIIIGERYPEFTWSQPLLALYLGLGISAVLFFTKLSLGRGMFGLIKYDENESPMSQPFSWIGYLLILFTFITGFYASQISLKEFLSESGLEGARRIFKALFNPNWAIFEEGLFAAIETIYMAFIATAVAIPVAFILGFFAARNLMNTNPIAFSCYTLLRAFLNISRSIEPLVWAIIFSVWVGIGPFSGMLALCIHSIASLTKQYSEQIESIDDGPIEAITATGAHQIQIVWFGVVPQIILPYLSYTIYRWDINVRMATVIGLVGGGGIGNLLMQYQGQARWNEVGMLVILIAAIVWTMDWASSKLREALK
ncbi:MAG: phosphonate ABC transporter, permease protein PhnE [Bacteriovorax sp.]|nr:phosphonate ABC transporter, permease protein PhnE [Bacteriovorax sp.]